MNSKNESPEDRIIYNDGMSRKQKIKKIKSQKTFFKNLLLSYATL